MQAQTFQFRSYPAEKARQLAGGPSWGRRFLLSLGPGIALLFVGAAFSTFEPRAAAVGLILVGVGLLAFSLVAFGIWLWRSVCAASGRPWARLLVVGLIVVSVANGVAIAQHMLDVLPALNALQWAFAIALLVRVGWLATRRAPRAEAAIWAAGATGEDLVAQALAELTADHVVIHNLPLAGHGDADHVVVGPAGVVVIETKYLAGRITCTDQGDWIQVKRDEVRRVADPAEQVLRAAWRVEGMLKSPRWDVPVRAVLVLAHPRAELDVARSPVPVVRPSELVPLLRQLSRAQAYLDGRTVAAVANALVDPTSSRRTDRTLARQTRGQALVELACAMSVVLVLAFGLLGVARVTGALLGLTAVAREAARAGARAPDASTAFDWASSRGQQVAAEYGLAGIALDIDTSSFETQPAPGLLVPGEIRVRADLTVDLSDVPLVSWAQLQVPLERGFAEVVDPYRSAPPPTDGGSP